MDPPHAESLAGTGAGSTQGGGLPAQQLFRGRWPVPGSPCPCPAASSSFSTRNPKCPPTRDSSVPLMPCPGNILLEDSKAREEPGESPAAHSLPEAVQCCEHHVCGVQRVDEVGGKGVLLLHSVRFPAGQSRAQRSWGISGPKMTALAQRQCHPSLGVRGLPWMAPKPCCSVQLSAAQGDNGSSGTP